LPTETQTSSALIEEIRSGRSTEERRLAICAEAAALAPDDRIEPLCVLNADKDPAVRDKAAAALQAQPLKHVLTALARPTAAPEMFAYCAAEFPRRPGVADALAQNKTCPIEVIRPVIRYLSAGAMQELFEDLDRLSTSPALVAEMIASGVITVEQRAQLQELQKAELEPEAAFAEAAKEAEPDAARRETLLQKLSKMRVVERVQRALKGGREERMLLIRDPCKVVQRAVLQSPLISEQEVETFAGMASLTDETLRLIAGNRKFRKNYAVVRGLMFNPKSPLEVTLHLLPHLKAQDLKFLTMSKNIPETLRTAAFRLQRQRAAERSGGGS
jgi:hypothetical protein